MFLYACIFMSVICIGQGNEDFCTSKNDVKCQNSETGSKYIHRSEERHKRYILYSVNPGEGFNLCRDVYLRISVLMKRLRDDLEDWDWILVLPPWGPLYHWKTKAQNKIPWSAFFDLNCMNSFIPVIEFTDFIKEYGPRIDVVYYLQHDDWDEQKEWVDKAVAENCKSQVPYSKDEKGHYWGRFWGYENVYAVNVTCVTVLGHASLLIPLLANTNGAIMIDRAEVVLHDNFGDSVYWQSRRSMQFAKHLINVADDFRRSVLNSTDSTDSTFKTNCQDFGSKPKSQALGGNYIAVHLRRQDFIHSRKKDVPSLDGVAEQLKRLQKSLQVSTVFVASDSPNAEMEYLKSLVPEILCFMPTEEQRQQCKDGGIAIIDQWICAQARYFIGTHESTFSFRIQEEREIMGFDPDTTFNRLCGDNQSKCEQPARWRIVYD